MSEPKVTEEGIGMLNILEDMWQTYAHRWDSKDLKTYIQECEKVNAICRLIEQGRPRVTRRFVNEFASCIMEVFDFEFGVHDIAYDNKKNRVIKEIEKAFRSKGMEVSDE